MVSKDALDIKHIGAIENREMHRLVRYLVKVAHVRQRRLSEISLSWHPLAEFEHPNSQLVAVVGAFDRTDLNKRCQTLNTVVFGSSVRRTSSASVVRSSGPLLKAARTSNARRSTAMGGDSVRCGA